MHAERGRAWKSAWGNSSNDAPFVKPGLTNSVYGRLAKYWPATFNRRGRHDEGIPTPYEVRVLNASVRINTDVRVDTMYKTKDKKVRPVDLGVSDGSRPRGVDNWKEVVMADELPTRERGDFDHLITPKFSKILRGSRLTAERVDAMVVGGGLLPRERELLIALLYNREKALAFDFSHCGTVRPEVAPPQEIRTVEHDAWQVKNFPVPKALVGTVVDMLRERLSTGVLEYCYGPYRNPWFLVKKSGGRYRLINAAMEMNRVTVRDANLPPATDEFAEEFAGNVMASLID